MKEQNKTPGENPNEMDVSNIPDKEFKATVLTMLSKLSRRMEQHSVNFNKALGEKKKKKEPVRTEEYNNWNEKYTPKEPKQSW